MSQTQADPILDSLVNDFGGNYTFALEVLEQYRTDRGSVDPSWRAYFDRVLGVPAETEPAPVEVHVPPRERTTTHVATLVRQEPMTPGPLAAGQKSKALLVPAILPGDIAQPIRGGALRVVENMEASLAMPTATSVRTMPVRTMEENRAILNKHRAAQGASKTSFTHLIAWAILRALDTFPRLNDAYVEL
jgi:2-oxoglutarate decarboxylase